MLIIIFHDMGKILYQANVFLDREEGVKYINFKGHFSTYLADDYLWLSGANSIGY